MTETQLVAFATDTLYRLFGHTALPCCFLAGGAYKTLLHGRPPRDLDLWAETLADREQLLSLLSHHGREQPSAPGAQRFLCEGTLVEVSFQVETMEERLARFDLGLSCLAVAFRGESRVPLLHPLALRSIQRREILLIRLAHPTLALATLVRARRYASDLGYAVPEDVESLLWSSHTGLSDMARREQLAQLRFHYGDATYGVANEVEERLAPAS